MNDTRDLNVEINPRIKLDDCLGPAVLAATDYFRKESGAKPGIVLPTGRMSWTVEDRPTSGKYVLLRYTEPVEGYETTLLLAEERFHTRTLLDPVERDVSMLQLLQNILKWRLQDVNIRIANRLKDLDTEEQNAHAH